MTKNKKSIEEFEKELEVAEKTTEIMLKVQKEEIEKKKRKNKMIKATKEKADIIREDLKEQLISQNKFGKQFDDLIEDYIFLVNLKEELQFDIKENGIRYSTRTGNGYMTDKPNESVQNLLKVNAQMLKILQDLELKAPDEGGETKGDDLL